MYSTSTVCIAFAVRAGRQYDFHVHNLQRPSLSRDCRTTYININVQITVKLTLTLTAKLTLTLTLTVRLTLTLNSGSSQTPERRSEQKRQPQPQLPPAVTQESRPWRVF